MSHKYSTMHIIAFLFIASMSLAAMADTLTWTWEPNESREDGTLITGDVLYKINTCYELLTPDTEFTITLDPKIDYTFELRQLENGVEGEPIIKKLRIE